MNAAFDLFLSILLGLVGMGPTEAEWYCRSQVEIACFDGRCRSAPDGEFTSMSLSFRETGAFYVGYYEGRWIGLGVPTEIVGGILIQDTYSEYYSGEHVKGTDEFVSILFLREKRLAFVSVNSIATPLTCKTREEKFGGT